MRSFPVAERLSIEEIDAIEELELDPDHTIWDVRNWFLFAFYAGWMRFSDVVLLRRKHLIEDDQGKPRVSYKMKKTDEKTSVKLVEPALEILEHYADRPQGKEALVCNVLDGQDLSSPEKEQRAISRRNAFANKKLKVIQRRAGIEKNLSFHLSRHSFADFLRRKDVSLYDISKFLGHANVGITEKYLAGFDREG